MDQPPRECDALARERTTFIVLAVDCESFFFARPSSQEAEHGVDMSRSSSGVRSRFRASTNQQLDGSADPVVC